VGVEPTIEEGLMKKTIALLIALCGSVAWADVSVVREWQPEPGRAAEMYQRANEARAIHEALGASVYIASDQNNNMHYVLTFADWGAWAKFTAASQASKEWAAFVAKLNTGTPSATSVNVLFLNQPVVAKATAVTIVYGWKVNPGKGAAFVALAQQAAAIHTKLGASPGINIDDLGNVWYETAFDSWAAWAAFDAASAKSKEWTDFLANANKEPMAELVRVLRLQQVPAPK
jgi:hypothetical protein